MKRSSISDLHTVLLLLCALLSWTPVSADGAEPTSVPDEYNAHVEAGNRLSIDKNYAAALKEFETAYSIAQRPRLLINLGRCLYRLGRAHDALAKYDQFERTEPNADTETQLRLAKYKEDALRALVSGTSNSSYSQDSDVRATLRAKPDRESARSAVRTPNTDQASLTNEQPATFSRVPPKPAVVLMSIGAALLLGGVGLGVAATDVARSIDSRDNQNHVFDAGLQSAQTRGHAFNIAAVTFDVVGPLALAVGSVWAVSWLVQRKTPKKLAWSPRAGQQVLSGGF